MSFVGIIAEYNPFHNGHAAQLAMLREQGAETIAVCMSSGAVQRGELPLLPESVRVQAALQNGADIAVALPAPYACATAETFAAAGVHLLALLGCDTLAFGAETPDAPALLQAAVLLQSADFTIQLRNFLDDGLPFAAARSAAADLLLPGTGALLQAPNNILAVEYCKAILNEGATMKPLPLPRLGAVHGGSKIGCVETIQYASASYLRDLVRQGGVAAIQPFVPPAAYELYCAAAVRGELLDQGKFSTAALALLRSKEIEHLAKTRGTGEGLENRLASAIKTSCTVDELYTTLATKRYPHARLRRLVLDAALGTEPLLKDTKLLLPPYLHVLGAKKTVMPLLQKAALPAATSLASLEKINEDCARIAALHTKATDFSSLCRVKTMPMGLAYTTKAMIL